MYVTDYLSKELKPGKTSNSPRQLLQQMESYVVNHLPLFEGLTYIGNIAHEELIALMEDQTTTSFDYKPYSDTFYLTSQHTLWDAIQLMDKEQTNCIPVFDEDGFKFLGLLTQEKLISGLADNEFISAQGVSMVITIHRQEYSMTTISNIIEANNGQFLAAVVLGYSEDDIQVLVKFNSENLLSIGETFERYGYQIVQKFYTDQKDQLLQHRYAQLLKFMNT